MELESFHEICTYAFSILIRHRGTPQPKNLYQKALGCAHCADATSPSPQVLSLALAISSPSLTAKQPAEMHRSDSSARRGSARKKATDASREGLSSGVVPGGVFPRGVSLPVLPRGNTAGTRALLLVVVGALLLRGATASGTRGCVNATTSGVAHTCAIMVRKGLHMTVANFDFQVRWDALICQPGLVCVPSGLRLLRKFDI